MERLDERSLWMLKATAVLCYATAALMLSGAALMLIYWHLTSFVVKYCAALAAIASAFIYAAIRNQREVQRRKMEPAKPPTPNPDATPE